MNRAYAVLQIRSVSEDRRVIEGWATTPDVDRVGDVVEPLGVQFRNPLVLLHQHDALRPVGEAHFERPTAKGVRFTATLPKISAPPSLKERVDTAWSEVRSGLIKGVSIGFRALRNGHEMMKGGGIRWTAIEVLELSLVSVPANSAATIATVKRYDRIATRTTPNMMLPPLLPGSVRLHSPGSRQLFSAEYLRTRGSRQLFNPGER